MSESTGTPYPIMAITIDQMDEYARIAEHAFHHGPANPAARKNALARLDLGRTLAAFDGPAPVGSAAAFSFQLTVPGGSLPTAGVTWVNVLPSHRRRGVLRSLMLRQLADISERGEPLAALWASEAPLYGRYGYGPASWTADVTVKRGEGALTRAAASLAAGLRLRLAEPADARPEMGKVYDTVLAARPGFFRRNDPWWQRAIADYPEQRGDASPLRCVLAEDASGPRGYALYSATARWAMDTGLPDSSLSVRELIADGPEASAVLWADLLSRDLVSTFNAGNCPADDPLLFQLADARRARQKITDGLWVRIIDVARALAGREYAVPVDVVIEVRDEILGANAGRWHLASGGLGSPASCARTLEPADLTVDVAQLGAAYLGGTRLGALAGAGLVREHTAGAARRLSAALTWDPAPWCPMIF